MSKICSTCERSETALTCGICEQSVCKGCAQFAGEESVNLLEEKPKYFSHGVFCQSCFSDKVEPEISKYNEVFERAGQVNVFYKTEHKESRFIRRVEKPLHVKDCLDHEDTLMRLAFKAASLGFNLLVDVETTSEKVRTGGYQTSNWQGTGIPGHIDENKLKRRFMGTPN